ncbi:MAG: helix-turn-helix transcriptional regulator [Clostridia bacterium]|nr:helix-turn-helix transcriptional regulator [Clostridia bacterium]
MNSCNPYASECGGCVSEIETKNKRYEPHVLSDPSTPYVFHASNRTSMPHWHENIEILYFLGDGGIVCDRTAYEVHEHDIAVFNSNVLHSVPRSTEVQHSCLIIDGAFLAKCDINTSEIKFDCVISDDKARELYLAAADVIGRRRENDDAFAAAEVKSAILALMVHLCRNFSQRDCGEQGHGDSVKRALGYIKSHFDEPLTVDQIANSVNVSKYYFCREFHRETGFTVVRYINNLRCREAEKLLREGKYTVSEVARMCGFENPSYFTRTYKTIIGHTPSESYVSTEKA